MKQYTCIALLSVLCLSCSVKSAVVVSTSYSNNTGDDDSHSTGDALTGSAVIGAVSDTLNEVGNSVDLGRRFTGANSGRGDWAASQQLRSIVQNVDVTVTWSIVADALDIYSFDLSTALHGYLNIEDESASEANDIASFSGFSASLKLNGSTIGDGLDLSGGSRTTVGSSYVDDTASQVLTDLSGNNTIVLRYTGTVTAAWKNAGFASNRTADAALWGSDGTMNGGAYSDSFDNYSSSAARSADGLFLQSTITYTELQDNGSTVPEPASLLMMCVGVCILVVTRRFSKARTTP